MIFPEIIDRVLVKKVLIKCNKKLSLHIMFGGNYMKNNIIPEMLAACIINVLSCQTSLHTIIM